MKSQKYCGKNLEHNDIFTRHRLDIGMNHNFKVNLTSKDNQPKAGQNPLMPVNLRWVFIVEPAFLHKRGIITALPSSKNASLRFAWILSLGKTKSLSLGFVKRHEEKT